MRISDWSSDVCSSDLSESESRYAEPSKRSKGTRPKDSHALRCASGVKPEAPRTATAPRTPGRSARSARGGDRKSVVEGKRVSVRVELGGRRILNKKNIRIQE